MGKTFLTMDELIDSMSSNTTDSCPIHRDNNFYFKKLIFKFKFDIKVLIDSIIDRYQDTEGITFEGSTFECPVDFNESKDNTNSKKSYNIKFDFEKAHFKDSTKLHGINFQKDINFTGAIFEKDAEFSELSFNEYFRLFGATFKSDVSFAHSNLSDKVIFRTNETDLVQFNRNVNFCGTKFKKTDFWDFVFKKDVSFLNTEFDCDVFFNRASFEGKTTFGSARPAGMTIFKKNVYFDNAKINEIDFFDLSFENAISFNSAEINSISIRNVHCLKTPLSLVDAKIVNAKDEGTARFLKLEATKAGNTFLAVDLNAKEMTMHYKQLNWCGDFGNKLILRLNKCSTNFGTNPWKGAAFILICWIIFFSLFAMCRDGLGVTLIWRDKGYLRESISYLWLFNGLDGLGKEISWGELLSFIIGKVLIIYGIYQTIAAFRKYGK